MPRRPSPVLYSEGPGGKSQDQSLQDPNISTSREVGHEDSSTKEVPFDTSHGFSEGESPPYLVLPRPLPPPAPIRPYVTLIDSIWDTLRRRTPLVFIRIFKSFLLIIKVSRLNSFRLYLNSDETDSYVVLGLHYSSTCLRASWPEFRSAQCQLCFWYAA